MAAEEERFQYIFEGVDNISKIADEINGKMDSLTGTAKKQAGQFDKTAFATQTLATAFGFSLAQGLSLAKQQVQASMKIFLDFETALAKTNTVLKASPEGLKELSKSIDSISSRLPVARQELADATFAIASAGIASENMAGILELSGRVAVGAMTDTQTAFEGIIAVIKGYNLDVTEATMIADMFFKTNELGQTTVEEVATSIQKVTAVASTAGVSLTELFAVYSTFTGVTGNAAEVTTQFKSAILALSAPTQEASKRLDELGVSYGKAAIEEKGFATVAKDVFDAVGGDIEQLRKLIPEKEALTFVAALATSQMGKFQESLDGAANSSGSLEEAVITMSNTMEGKFLLAQNKADIFRGKIGGAFVHLQAAALDMASGIAGVAKTLAGIFWFIPQTMAIAFEAGLQVVYSFINGFTDAAKDVVRIAKNIAHNISAAFSNKESVKIFEGTTSSMGFALEQVALDAKESWGNTAEFIGNSFDQWTGSGQAQMDAVNLTSQQLSEQIMSTGDAASGALNEISDGAGGAGASMDELSGSVDDLEKVYEGVEETGVEALEELQKAAAEALDDIEKKMGSVFSKMESVTADFLAGQAGGQTDLAQAFVEQEQKIASLKDELSNLQGDENADADRIAQIKDDLAAEESALNDHKDLMEGIAEELNEARRRASLTDFEQTVEDLQAEATMREEEFNKEMQRLADELSALQAQKDEIMRLEEATTAAINDLRQSAAVAYTGLLQEMESQTVTSVNAMVTALEQLAAALEDTGGVDIAAASAAATQGTPAEISSESVYNISVTVEGSATEQDAVSIAEEIQRQIELINQGVE
jgi:TP901 family phage tail tape measure protein